MLFTLILEALCTQIHTFMYR